MGMPWSQQAKLKVAGDTVATWRTQGAAVGIEINQVNVRILPPAGQESDPPSDVVFEWNPEADEFMMRTSGT